MVVLDENVGLVFLLLGAVLIFLPGYDDIVALRDRILYDDERFSAQSKRYI